MVPTPTATPTPAAGKNTEDVAAITALINAQKALGATVGEDLDNREEYIWSEDGRLAEINWENKNLQGSLSLKGLPEVRILNCFDNGLASLDVSNCTALEDFDYDDGVIVTGWEEN